MRIRWKGVEIIVESEDDIELVKKLIGVGRLEVDRERKVEKKVERPRKVEKKDYEAEINKILEKHPELKEFKEYLVKQGYKHTTVYNYLCNVVRYILGERDRYKRRWKLSQRTLKTITNVRKIYNEFLESRRGEKRGLEALFSEEEDDFDLKKHLLEQRRIIEETMR
ncbi:hypothetical protein DRP04_03600 [Archaeoglobales archaeon]|nr:MAG: hypothetical protein DRP04_03600 [Archaeoglobales archaeon]